MNLANSKYGYDVETPQRADDDLKKVIYNSLRFLLLGYLMTNKEFMIVREILECSVDADEDYNSLST